MADWYSKEDALCISAVAVLLMVWHHCFGFREYLADGVEWQSLMVIRGIEIERVVAAFGKICVALYAFNSGYVAWKQRSDYSILSIGRRAIKFIIAYWVVLALFWGYALVCNHNLPSGSDLWLNLVGLATGPGQPYVNVSFAWYVAYYIVFLLLCPLLLKFYSGGWKTDVVVTVALLVIIHYVVLNIGWLNPLLVGVEGLIFSKYNIFGRLPKINAVVAGGLIIFVIILRQMLILSDTQLYKWGGRYYLCPCIYISHGNSFQGNEKQIFPQGINACGG